MTPAATLAPFVQAAVRRRGARYFQQRRVGLGRRDADRIEASVRGSRVYRVLLVREADTLRASCTCPFFATGDCCKHVWATVLAAAADGRLADAAGRLPQRLMPEARRPGAANAAPARWRNVLAGAAPHQPETARPPRLEELLYVLDVPAVRAGQGFSLEILQRTRKHGGEEGRLRHPRLPLGRLARLPPTPDREVLQLLAGIAASAPHRPAGRRGAGHQSLPVRSVVPEAMVGLLVPLLCATGRFHLRRSPRAVAMTPLAWEDGPPWELVLELRTAAGGGFQMLGSLRRGAERMALADPVLLLPSGILVTNAAAAPLAPQALGWIAQLRQPGGLHVAEGERAAFLEELLMLPDLPPLELPPELEQVQEPPQPVLRLWGGRAAGAARDGLRAELSFGYGSGEVVSGAPGPAFYDAEAGRLFLRDPATESRAGRELEELGFRTVWSHADDKLVWRLHPSRLAAAIASLLAAGWRVEADGRRYATAGVNRLAVASGIDWFELRGEVAFGEQAARLPELLAALRRGESFVRLGDGSYGLLPVEWLRRLDRAADLGRLQEEGIRFSHAQAPLLDALLAGEPEVSCDAAFARARQRLHAFAGVQPVVEPGSFQGTLRAYQREGLGWFDYLREFDFGGCLADDMGLGKTVQVLALLEARRVQPEEGKPRPSLVVVPRSLIFNWLAEAERFTPELRVINHTGLGRAQAEDGFAEHDLVLTTYGTLRRDAALLHQVEWDYVILDEAQAIKNADSQSAKAVRLLRGRHRLALSGTPVENHLGELWSLLDFLNPGLLGASSVLRAHGGALRSPDEATRKLLASAVRPFILRRTKQQVAAELPDRVEQTLYCELPTRQRRLYDELRDGYRAALGQSIGERGLGKSKILVLEALLRLRQAACHPGLLDEKRREEPSAKLDLLLPQLEEVLDEGHKALVFSQFTSFLALLRRQLDEQGIPYEYLDGRTRDRAKPVERFQSDPDCRLFLISLKAGGLGLNLTAADYVYLLDPWWNPAVEAQAIDRAHRIGQLRHVFAYRLVARDTVEEKILELQQSKRELADAIIQADQGVLRSLTREDLELLLS